MPFAPSSALALAQYGHHSIEYICTRAIVTSAYFALIPSPRSAIPAPKHDGATREEFKEAAWMAAGTAKYS